jgi:hypothetical protein
MKVFDKGFTLTWLGHSSFHLVTPRGKHFLIDPWMEGNPMTPLGDAPITQVDAILLTHAHGDHSGDVLRLAQQHGATVVCIHEAAAWLESHGAKHVVGMNKGGSTSLHGVRLTMTTATHSSSFHGPDGPVYGGDPAGFVVTLENGVPIYFTGDTGPTMDMQIVADLYHPEVVVMPIGDHYTMGPREAAYAARLIRAPFIVPCHYGTFPLLTGTPEALEVELAKLGVNAKVVVSKPGQSVR